VVAGAIAIIADCRLTIDDSLGHPAIGALSDWIDSLPNAASRTRECATLQHTLALAFHHGEGVWLVPDPGHRGDDAARLEVDHVEVPELL
jgi:hypothetical protein